MLLLNATQPNNFTKQNYADDPQFSFQYEEFYFDDIYEQFTVWYAEQLGFDLPAG
jgi:hypothetical protein